MQDLNNTSYMLTAYISIKGFGDPTFILKCQLNLRPTNLVYFTLQASVGGGDISNYE